MTEKLWTSVELEAGMRALVRTLAPDGPLSPGATRVVAAVQAHLGCRYQAEDLAPISSFSLAARLPDPWLRLQLVRALVVGILIDDACTPAALARVEAVASALGVDEPALVDVAYYLAGKRWRLRRRIAARMWSIDHLKARIAERGFLRTVVPVIYSTFFRRYRNRDLARRYAALRDLPDGSLGRGYIAYLEANRFPLPGERGAITDLIVPHDLAHVLSDYSTQPAEEVLVGSFSAGHRAKDPFAFVMFVLFQFHLGLRMTPGADAERGLFDPAKVLAAIERGAAVTRDLTATSWNFWADLELPLEEVRRVYRIAPRAPWSPTRPLLGQVVRPHRSRFTLVILALLATLAVITASTAFAEPPARTELGFHFGLVQPVLLHGFNAAIEVRRGRWLATYSHGQGIEASRLGGTLTQEESAANMRLMMPWTTGGGVGYRVFGDLYILADVKVHHYEAYAGAALAEYSTVTVGGEVGWRWKPWKGLTITPVVRYWPNVWDSAPSGGVVVKTSTGGELMHQPAKQGIDGLFVNVLVGWSFDLDR